MSLDFLVLVPSWFELLGSAIFPFKRFLTLILGFVNFDHYINQIENANLRILRKRILQACVNNMTLTILMSYTKLHSKLAVLQNVQSL